MDRIINERRGRISLEEISMKREENRNTMMRLDV